MSGHYVRSAILVGSIGLLEEHGGDAYEVASIVTDQSVSYATKIEL